MTFVAQLRTGPQANPRRPRDAQRPPCLGETLLPKKQALPIASDALSSVAYAPDEILLMLGIAGAAFAYTHSWKVALGVVFVMVVVVASYRQNVHAYPSGGGDYEVATANLGPRAGLTHQGRQFLLKDEPGGQEIRAHQQQCTPRPGRRIVYRAAPVITDADVLIRPLRNPPVTRHVLDLYEASQASMPACAIALAERLPGLGAVLLVDRDFESDELKVRYASVHPDPGHGWPKVYPWPGQVLPVAHPLRFLTAGAAVQRRTFWATPWDDRADFYMDAVANNDRRIVAVLTDTDLWGAEKFHPNTTREFDQRPEQKITCCGRMRTARGYPCQECGQVHCPICGKCRCDRQNDELVTCSGGCFLSYRPNLLVDGRCEDCR